MPAPAAGARGRRERRVNPEDRRLYTLGELLFLLAGEYEPHEIREYWEASCLPAGPAAGGGLAGAERDAEGCAERRLSPWDRRTYTLAEMLDAFRGDYREEEIETYWRQRCRPAEPGARLGLGIRGLAEGAHGRRAAAACPEPPASTSTASTGLGSPPSSGSSSSRCVPEERRPMPARASPCTTAPRPTPPCARADLEHRKQDRWPAAALEKAEAAGQTLAASRKLTGNDLFRKGCFEAAREEYSMALGVLPDRPAAADGDGAPDCQLRAQILNNRAACEHQLRNWEAVIEDTTVVLELEPTNAKALLRRAIAAEALEHFAEAHRDASVVLALEPGHPQANAIRGRTRDLQAEAAAACRHRGGRRLEPGAPGVARLEDSLANFCYDDMEVLNRGFPWGATDFFNGHEENLRVLQDFEDELAAKAYTGPPFWWGLDDAMASDPEILRMALDIVVAYLKNYQLDRCEAVARYVLPAARARGLPWNVKALQDCATLRMKQARQAEAALLLEEINQYVPPNPIHCKNLGITYNQLRQHDRALECFEAAVRLQKGVKHPSDLWDIGIAKKHLRCFDEALPALLDALQGFREEHADPVTLAKITDNVGSCYLEMGKAYCREAQYGAWAEPYLAEAESLYRSAVGIHSPLYGGTVRLLARALLSQGRFEAAEQCLRKALRVEVEKDAIHPTPIHDLVEDLLEMAGSNQLQDCVAYHDVLHDAIKNLEKRGFCEDGNGGMVLHKVARFLAISGSYYQPAALDYLRRALVLIRNHRDPPVDTSMHCAILELEIHTCEQLLQSRLLAILDAAQPFPSCPTYTKAQDPGG